MVARDRFGPDGTRPVLLVDDEREILTSFSIMLQSAGIKPVATAHDSREVLPMLERQPARLVVLDLSMPHLSGRELLARITETWPEIPIIVVTGTNELEVA